MTKIIIYIIVGVIALYLAVAVVRYVCFGRSHEGPVIQPGEFSVTVE